jgi:hypothetical protein
MKPSNQRAQRMTNGNSKSQRWTRSAHRTWGALAALLFFTHAAGATLPASQRVVDYAALAGPAVSSARFTRLLGWHDVPQSATSLGPMQLIVQSDLKRAVLITFFSPCYALDFNVQIGISSFGRQISAGFDKVLLPHHESCRIKTLQPLDVKAMRAAEKAARSGLGGPKLAR